MSPSEAELRAALRAGAGERLDADEIMHAAVAARRQRRARATGVAASVLVVSGVAVVATVLGSRSSSPVGGSGPARPASAALTLPAGPAGGTATEPSPAACPASVPSLMSPGGVLPAQDSGPLLPSGVTTLTVCIYASPLEASSERLLSGSELSSADAAKLVSAFDALPDQPLIACGDTVGRTVALFATAADGRRTEVVGSASACGRITNGTVVRYGRDLLLSLAGGPGSTRSGGTTHPSPGPGPS